MGNMCGRFAVTTDPALLAEKIQAIDESTAAMKDSGGPNYNVAPTTTISTVVKRHTEPDDDPTRPSQNRFTSEELSCTFEALGAHVAGWRGSAQPSPRSWW